MFANACKTTYAIDKLAYIKELLVKHTLAGRGNKILKTASKYYSTRQLIHIDSGFLMIFEGSRE